MSINIVVELIKGEYLSKEALADKMGVSVSTIIRWSKDTKPSYAERKLLKQIYNGYKQESPK